MTIAEAATQFPQLGPADGRVEALPQPRARIPVRTLGAEKVPRFGLPAYPTALPGRECSQRPG